MKGIKMSDCKFYVDESARTIVCVIPNTRDMLIDFIRDNFAFSDIDLFNSLDFWGKFRIAISLPNSFVGKAVCAPEDEWNEELGRVIAFAKAKDKCYKSFFKRANLFVQTIDRRLGEAIELFNDFGTKLEEKREGLQSKIDSSMKVVEVELEEE